MAQDSSKFGDAYPKLADEKQSLASINKAIKEEVGRIGERASTDYKASQETEAFDPQMRYLRNGRDLAQWVHYDYPQLAFQNAAFIVFNVYPIQRAAAVYILPQPLWQ